jgi:hypothetical protein
MMIDDTVGAAQNTSVWGLDRMGEQRNCMALLGCDREDYRLKSSYIVQ